jgi:cell division septal protein FtsQ
LDKKKPVSTIKSIQKEIQDKKKQRQQAALRKVLKWAFILVMGIGLALTVFLYEKSDYSKVNEVIVEGNYYVSDQEVINELDFELGTSFYKFLASNLEKKVPADSFVESINVTKHWFNQSMTIEVTEKKVIGYRLTDKIEMIAIDGSIKGLLEGQFEFLRDLPRFSGFNDSAALEALVDGISRTDSVLYSNISEIVRSPKTYDENYIKAMMADGVQLHSSIYSLESLDAVTFTEIYNRLNEDQKCIVYDVFWRSTYVKPCEEAIEELEGEEIDGINEQDDEYIPEEEGL